MSDTTLPSGHPARNGFTQCPTCGIWRSRGFCLCNVETEKLGAITVRKGAKRCTVCNDDDTKRPDCRACGGVGLDDLNDVLPEPEITS